MMLTDELLDRDYHVGRISGRVRTERNSCCRVARASAEMTGSAVEAVDAAIAEALERPVVGPADVHAVVAAVGRMLTIRWGCRRFDGEW
jgi:hypothetical protein